MAAVAGVRLAVCAVAVTALAAVAVGVGFGLLGRSSAAEPSGDALTPQQVDAAVAAARWAESQYGPADIVGATAIAVEGTTVAGDLGSTCRSGRVVEVNVYGSFPHVSTGGKFIPNDEESQTAQGGGPSSAIVYLDGVTGRRCLNTFSTGSHPIPGATILYGQAP